MAKMSSVMILFGGISSEHEVACNSAASILKNIDNELWNVYKVGITKDGRWLLTFASPEDIENGNWLEHESNQDVALSPNRKYKGLYNFNTGETYEVDCVFPVLHGMFGEDGTVQGLCEVAGIPYVGCDVPSSALSMDKALTKRIVNETSIKQADYMCFKKGDIKEVSDGYAKNFLLKGKLAIVADAKNMNVLKTQEGSKMFKRERDFEEAKRLAEKMKDMKLSFKVKAGEGGKLFGSVTSKDISDKLFSEYKIETDKKKVFLDDAIKTAGITMVEIKLFEGVIAKIKVEVIAE